MPVPIRYYANKFNRGEIDDLALARDDVTRVNNSASFMSNFMPIRLGPMTYRPGFEYLDELADATAVHQVPFVAATDDTAMLEFTDDTMRVWVDDEIVTTTGKATAIANGTFNSNLTSWTDADDAGAVSAWVTGGYMSLIGNGASASAVRWQTTTGYEAGEHRLRIVIKESPCKVEIGEGGAAHSAGIFSGILPPGTHSLVFTPTGNFDITFSNSTKYRTLVDSVSIEATGIFSLTTGIPEASLDDIRYAQSADVIYLAWSGKFMKVERRGVKSWSIAEHWVNDGPFGLINSSDITLTPGALTGSDQTLTASKPYFKSTDVDSIFKLVSDGQTVSATVSAENTGTGSIRVVGVGTSRVFNISVVALSSSTVTLQRSLDDSTWTDVESYTGATSKSFDDGFDNSILYYRLWVKTGDYGADTPLLTLSYPGGSISGIARVISYTSSTVVRANIIVDFGGSGATLNWYRGEWDATQGYPTAVGLYEGRLWWAGRNRGWGSVSDAFDSHDGDLDGDSAAISKTIGFGPVDNVDWLLSLNRLLMGIASDVLSIRSNSFGDVLTPSNSNIKPGSSQGAAPVQPVSVSSRGYYVQRSTKRVYELDYTLDQDIHDAEDLCVLNPDICDAGIKRIAVTMQPEIRIYAVLDNGEARVFLLDKFEEVKAWSRIVTDGDITDVAVLPDVTEDRVYFAVSRTGGHYLEKMALFSEAQGGTISKHTDSFVQYTSPGINITGLDHLNNKTVHIWADGQYRGSDTVSVGTIALPGAYTNVVIGLQHTAQYTSSKLGNFSTHSVLTYDKRVVNVGFILKNYWPGGIQVGESLTDLSDFPGIEDGKAVVTTATLDSYDQKPFPFAGRMETDPRISLQATQPCTILAMSYGVDESADQTGKVDALKTGMTRLLDGV